MQFILDACTVIHLLQADIVKGGKDTFQINHNFFSLLKKLKCEIVIINRVQDEVRKNFSANLSSLEEQKLLEAYINHHLPNYIDHKDNDYIELLDFVKSANNYTDDNGELHCATYALYKARYEDESLYQTNFFTDDDGASADFMGFYQANAIGNILATVDLLAVLYHQGLIARSVVMEFALNLKKLYVADVHNLLQLIDQAEISGGITGTQEQALLRILRELVDKTAFGDISQKVLLSKSYPSIKRNNSTLDKLLNKVILSDYKKLAVINKKIKQLQRLMWSLKDEVA